MLLQSRLFVRIASRNTDVYILKVVSLTIAFATGILVALFALHEFEYDTHYKDADNVFRILARNTDKDYSGNRLSAAIDGRALVQVRNALQNATVSRVKALNELNILSSAATFNHQQIHTVDPAIIEVLSLEGVAGDINKFINQKNDVAIISRRRSTQYFGNKSPIGETIRLTTFGDTVSVLVVAVFNDLPTNTHADFDFFIHYDSSAIAVLNYDHHQSNVYGRLSPDNITQKSLPKISNGNIEYLIQPVKKIYFGPRVVFEEARHGDMYSMVILICIVSLIFLLALCTFVNLSTITLPYRAKEIAVKKLAGTSQRQLLFQFLYESVTLTGLSLLLAVIIVFALRRYISGLLDIDVLHMMTVVHPAFLGIELMMISAVVVSPLLIIIRFVRASPTRLLSSDTVTFPKFKQTISIIQFGVSIFLIVSSLVVRRQIDYSLVKEPGQNNDQVVYIACPVNISDSAIYRIKGGWPERNPNIVDAMAVSQLPGQLKSKEANSDIFLLQVDYNFIDFFQFEMQKGRWFKPTDNDSATVVNQMAMMNMKNIDKNVIGLTKDLSSAFNMPEQPVKIRLAPNGNYNWLCFRLLEVDIRSTIQWIERRMAAKGSRGGAHFLNPHFESWLSYQDKLNALSDILTLISALLAGCAIYGLSVSLVRDKLKTIAMHHLFGAGTIDVTRILALDLLKEMLLALMFAGPLAYILLKELLRTFVYATKFSWADPLYPIGYCVVVIVALCGVQALNLNRSNLSTALKGRS
ncbi:ABC transporter permease [Chryseolinea sp. T2]|uniref:ABC transporter permease n=1 Tax=Chryseolinea sp. T2 TaxID=3129255 RepID=UPI003076E1A7